MITRVFFLNSLLSVQRGHVHQRAMRLHRHSVSDSTVACAKRRFYECGKKKHRLHNRMSRQQKSSFPLSLLPQSKMYVWAFIILYKVKYNNKK